jgi:hypothetical protein
MSGKLGIIKWILFEICLLCCCKGCINYNFFSGDFAGGLQSYLAFIVGKPSG